LCASLGVDVVVGVELWWWWWTTVGDGVNTVARGSGWHEQKNPGESKGEKKNSRNTAFVVAVVFKLLRKRTRVFTARTQKAEMQMTEGRERERALRRRQQR
jgi:hypothetical protein